MLLAGIGALWAGSQLVMRYIGVLAGALGVKELVVTILGVSVLSSLPELTVSAMAIARGAPDISLGNVIGSNFVTLTFVTAVCAMIRPIDIHREVQSRESSWMILCSAVVMVLAMDGVLCRSDGLILILVYVPYMLSVLRTSREGAEPPASGGRKAVAQPVLFIVAGVGLVVAGSRVALDSGTMLAVAAGIPEVALGVVILAFGTSLPELAISLSATVRHKADVTIGEVYSSNIFTQLVVLGICCLISPMPVAPALSGFGMPFLVLAAVVIQIFVTSGLKLNRIEALGLFVFYCVFAASQFLELPTLDQLLGF
jgi:cation:H+ antiporter